MPWDRRVQAAIDALGEQPRPHDVIALHGLPGAYRIRVGDYRVIYTLDDGRLVVLVVDLGHRREIYPDAKIHGNFASHGEPSGRL